MTEYTTEQLVELISAGETQYYEQLFTNLRPVILHEARMYIGTMDTYGVDDLIQEGWIVAWEIISRGSYKAGSKFSTYFGAAVRYRFCRIFRDFNLRNLVCVGEAEDLHGNVIRTLVESEYAKEYRKKKAAQQKRWVERKRAEEPVKEKKPPMTKEERNRKIVEYQRRYYAEHPDKLAERREKNRLRERERRARRKAQALCQS